MANSSGVDIVGHCIQYHPHGDASISDALVVLTNKQYLIEGQGNGNLFTGDPRQPLGIECRLTPLARTQLFNDELTEFVPSYDGRNKEPVCLPSKIPMLLMLGAEGIAVGLSAKILPHNFCELLEAQIAILRKQSFELLPDFPAGGLMDATAYEDGKGYESRGQDRREGCLDPAHHSDPPRDNHRIPDRFHRGCNPRESSKSQHQ